MKTLLFIFLWTFSINLSAQTSPKGDANMCKLWGTVFVEASSGFADFKVYVEDVESFSNVEVYKMDTLGFANRPGLWYFTNNRNLADFTIAIVDNKAFADFSIYYTNFQSLAGCR